MLIVYKRSKFNFWLFHVWVAIGMAGVLAIGWFVFQPGISGGFVFDDMPNLAPAGNYGGIVDRYKLVAFLLSSDFLPGRPLSLLTFVADDQGWPMNPSLLKHTNLMLHLVNGLLVCWLTFLVLNHNCKIAQKLGARWALSLAVTILWLINPVQVSTVSYIIQRMTELSALFVLVGMISYLKLRPHLEGNFGKCVIICSILEGLCYFLGIAAKENALLLGLFLWLLDVSYFSKFSQLNSLEARLWQVWRILFFFTPSILFMAYWIAHTQGFVKGYEGRDYSLEQRLLTQPRIIWDYIGSIFFPRINSGGLFNDSIKISVGLLSPVTTIIAILATFFILLTGWLTRNKIPLASFGIFFYFIGHLMESTFIPLELYFEHRNYLPQFGLWLALIGLFDFFYEHIKAIPFAAAFLCLCSLYGFIAREQATIWGDDYLLSEHWYRNSPGSIRAIQNFSMQTIKRGDLNAGLKILNIGLQHNPNSAALYLSIAYLECANGKNLLDVDKAIGLLRRGPLETASLETIDLYRKLLESRKSCKGLNYDSLQRMVDALIGNPAFNTSPVVTSRLYIQLAKITFSRRHLSETIEFYDKACELNCTAEIRWEQAVLLTSAGLYQEAMLFVKLAQQLIVLPLQRWKYPGLKEKLDSLESLLLIKLANV